MLNSLSVIIPAYNEEKVIEQTLNALLNYFQNQKYDVEILVVNDGSTDLTSSKISKFPSVKEIKTETNKGKGNAVKQGVFHATMNYILFMDADHAIDITNLNKFLNYVDQFDIIIGSKYLDSNTKYPLHRKIIGHLFSFLKKKLTGLQIKDTQCGFKLYSGKLAKELFAKSMINGWCFDVEILLLAQKRNIAIKELPINVKNSFRVSRINILGSGTQMFIDLLKLRANFISGKYK
jgi:dolichyl-phosphate beta-glucosyltransferase